ARRQDRSQRLRRHHDCDRQPRRHKGFRVAPTRWRQVAAARPPTRRPVGDGRVVSAHVGTRDSEDGAAGRPADQHPVPPARRPLGGGQPFTAAPAAVSRSLARWVFTGATGLSGSTNGLAVTITKKVPKPATYL